MIGTTLQRRAGPVVKVQIQAAGYEARVRYQGGIDIPVKTNSPTVAAKPERKALNGYLIHSLMSASSLSLIIIIIIVGPHSTQKKVDQPTPIS